MKNKLLLIPVLLFGFLVMQCEKENSRQENHTLNLSRTIKGGCNIDLKTVIGENPDTVIFTIEQDTLNLFTGINYICCAPFTGSLTCSNDSITATIKDVCPLPYNECYCHCSCYYTWDFKLTGYEPGRTYHYKVVLISTFEEEPQIIEEGNAVVTGNSITTG